MIIEQGSAWIIDLCAPGRHQLFVAEIALAEVAAALSARARVQVGFTTAERDRALSSFLADCHQQYRLIAITRSVIDLAVELTQRNRLRGYDAVQLASALRINAALLARQVPPLTFVTADRDLIAAAAAEGLAAENPNDY